jgi:hypothetical protein
MGSRVLSRRLRLWGSVLILALLASLAAAVPAIAEEGVGVSSAGTLFGTVTDSQTGYPIEGVEVYAQLLDEDVWWGDYTLTDENGEYEFSLGPAGSYEVHAMVRGYFSSGWIPFEYNGTDGVLHNVELEPKDSRRLRHGDRRADRSAHPGDAWVARSTTTSRKGGGTALTGARRMRAASTSCTWTRRTNTQSPCGSAVTRQARQRSSTTALTRSRRTSRWSRWTRWRKAH